MKIEECKIIEIKKVSHSILSLKLVSNFISKTSRPGQFVNIQIDSNSPQILRRPFSIADINNDVITILFNVVGKGTFSLSSKKEGDIISVLGPLGNGFTYNSIFDKAIILGGGIGVAPFSFLIRKLQEQSKEYTVYFGYRSSKDIIKFQNFEFKVSTDDGSYGYKGNVIQFFLSDICEYKNTKIKIFACGPNIMLKSLEAIAFENDFDVEVSIESYMACGIGICQGCPVPSRNNNENYLVCKDGPCFNIKDIIL